jgi:hypothetical protein
MSPSGSNGRSRIPTDEHTPAQRSTCRTRRAAIRDGLTDSSAQITLDRYTHLFEDDLEGLAESVDARYGAAQVRRKRISERLVDLSEKVRKVDIPRVL